jgi:hypothetical protein
VIQSYFSSTSTSTTCHSQKGETNGGEEKREIGNIRASFAMNVCGPTIFPTQYPVNSTAPVNCFFVYPATLLLTIVKLMLKPNP